MNTIFPSLIVSTLLICSQIATAWGDTVAHSFTGAIKYLLCGDGNGVNLDNSYAA